MVIISKNLDVAVLFDFYGELLTEKQRGFIEAYYDDDLSLAEIAANEGITRQGVRDAIKRSEAQLFSLEERLGLVSRFSEMRRGVDEIVAYTAMISDYNLRHTLSREINDYTVKIKTVAQTLLN